MLNVDDPAWPDNPEGDSMRIARDIDVAQMMSEAGFYDHAIRVLQTSFILARVNRDPQTPVVERQILAIAQLAQVKGVAVPLADLNYPDIDIKGDEPTAAQPTHKAPVATHDPVPAVFSEVESVVTKAKPEQPSPEPRPLPDISPPPVYEEITQKAVPAESQSICSANPASIT
jgi:hypothetical protein